MCIRINGEEAEGAGIMGGGGGRENGSLNRREHSVSILNHRPDLSIVRKWKDSDKQNVRMDLF